ncbi:MAG: nicotinamide-nucleotide amidohydrolase family protein [Eubacteriales bacterium]|nr:nicotinamide-nucleotide amidohydrolase family protein [Eubacteriales bacterium]
MGEKSTGEVKLAACMDTGAAEEELVRLLSKKGLTISTAESCTGGLVSAKLVNVAGASEVFREGFVTYSNKAKRKTLDVSKSTIRKEGAVSAQTAKEMAVGAALMADTDIAVSVTGNAGPSAEEDKPVGLVYIGVYAGGKARALEYHFEGGRNEIRAAAAEEAVKAALSATQKFLEKKETKTKENK